MRKRRLMLVALAVLVVLLGAVLAALVANRASLSGPPGPAARLATYLTRNVAEVTPDSPHPELRSPRYRMRAVELSAEIATLAAALGFEDVTVDDTRRRVTAVAVSPLFGFKDDIEVVVHGDDTQATVLARSSSRLGRGDLGANRNHLRRLLEALQLRLADRAAPP